MLALIADDFYIFSEVVCVFTLLLVLCVSGNLVVLCVHETKLLIWHATY